MLTDSLHDIHTLAIYLTLTHFDTDIDNTGDKLKHINQNLSSARPDVCPEFLAGRQGVTPKPQGRDFVTAPVVALSHLPQSPSAHQAGGDCDSDDLTSAFTNDFFSNKDQNSMNTSDFKGNYKKEDYDRSTIMGNASSMGLGDACDLVAANLSAYQDGELDGDQTRLVAAHVGNCPRCAEIFEAIQETDEIIEREWRESAPLPSSLQFGQALDSIMAALPPVPVQAVAFAPRRIHARARWTRFATGMAGVTALAASLWSSYQLGYTRGRSSVSAPAPSRLLSYRLPQSLFLPRVSTYLSSPPLRLIPASLFSSVSFLAPPFHASTAANASRSATLPPSPLRPALRRP